MTGTALERTIADLNTGETLTFLETSEETGGQRVVMRLTLAPGTVVPPHAHPIEESFKCEDGPVGFHLDGRWADLGPGDAVSAAPGRVHGLRNTSDQPVSVFVTATPGAIAEHQLRMKFLLSRDGYIPVPGGGPPKDPPPGAVIMDRDGLYVPTAAALAVQGDDPDDGDRRPTPRPRAVLARALPRVCRVSAGTRRGARSCRLAAASRASRPLIRTVRPAISPGTGAARAVLLRRGDH